MIIPFLDIYKQILSILSQNLSKESSYADSIVILCHALYSFLIKTTMFPFLQSYDISCILYNYEKYKQFLLFCLLKILLCDPQLVSINDLGFSAAFAYCKLIYNYNSVQVFSSEI